MQSDALHLNFYMEASETFSAMPVIISLADFYFLFYTNQLK